MGLPTLFRLPADGRDLSRWQLRYELCPGANVDRLEEVLRYLVARTGRLVIEANTGGLFLELPAAFDRYVEAQMPKALPELRLTRADHEGGSQATGPSFFCLGAPDNNLLRWATEGPGRLVRLHLRPGPTGALTVQTGGERPPGRWLRLPQRLGARVPVRAGRSTEVWLSRWFPPTDEGVVYASRSRLLRLAPPQDYTPDPAGRDLGQATDGRLLTLRRDLPLFTVGAPPSFLVHQALDDLQAGRSVVVVSPHRRLLECIAQQAGSAPVYWLDAQNSHKSAHLAVVSAEEWTAIDSETVVQLARTFLADLGLDIHLPVVDAFTRHLLHILAEFARQTGQDLACTDLHAVCQSTQALRVFLSAAPSDAAQALLAQLDDDDGYVQAVTILAAIRTALEPLTIPSFRCMCEPPSLQASELLAEGSLLLVPLANADFPEQDRLLSALLDLTLRRVLATDRDLRLALHLHDPHLTCDGSGQRWLDAARQDARLSLLLDTHQPDRYLEIPDEEQAGQLIFRCSEALAASLIGDWNLPASISDLVELPGGTALARLPGMIVTLKANEDGESSRGRSCL